MLLHKKEFIVFPQEGLFGLIRNVLGVEQLSVIFSLVGEYSFFLFAFSPFLVSFCVLLSSDRGFIGEDIGINPVNLLSRLAPLNRQA